MISYSPSPAFKALLACAVMAFGGLSHAQQVLRIACIGAHDATIASAVSGKFDAAPLDDALSYAARRSQTR